MKKQIISMGLLLVLLVSSTGCNAIRTVTPAVVPATAEIATIATILFDAPDTPSATETQAEPATATETVTPAGTTTPNKSLTPIKTGSPTATATTVPNSRSNPVPAGSADQIEGLQISVSRIVRPADSMVESGNPLNFKNEAGSGKEYLFIKVDITCEKPPDQECILTVLNFKALGGDGVSINPELTIAGVDGLLTSTAFYGGVTKTGYIPFIVTQGDTSILLVYQTVLGDKFYLALPESK